ncbi:MAG: hypothetical protein QCI00_02735, partial [Candidatus Thermoplasmatota archaeon]|nr:hypothetical protein [Candidatus Thermoplasmatota archaeon]
MNISSILLGLLLMIVGFILTVITFGFGIICTWPLILIGFILFIVGILSPSRFLYFQHPGYKTQYDETKQICSSCGKTMPLHATHCPHCGQQNK